MCSGPKGRGRRAIRFDQRGAPAAPAARREEAIIRQENELSLDERYCWIDVWAVERLIGHAEKSAELNGRELIRLTDKAAELYKGPFLSGETRTQRTNVFETRPMPAAAAADQRCTKSRREGSLAGSDRLLRKGDGAWDPCAEDVCRSLMSAYHHLGRPADVLATYRSCRDALANRLGTTPSAATESLLKRLQVRTLMTDAAG